MLRVNEGNSKMWEPLIAAGASVAIVAAAYAWLSFRARKPKR